MCLHRFKKKKEKMLQNTTLHHRKSLLHLPGLFFSVFNLKATVAQNRGVKHFIPSRLVQD